MHLKWIIFDFHGVLADFGHGERWIGAMADMAELAAPMEQLETGRIGIAEFLAALPPDSPSAGGLKLTVRPAMIRRVRLLREQGFCVGLLTNSFRGSAIMRDAAGIPNRLFHVVVESWQEGVRKPDPVIFERTLERAGARASECLFVDDQLQNVLAARELGFRVIQAGSVSSTLRAIDAHCGLDGGQGGS
jgi:epoxide hydrolase-like predicted phosphatase